MTTADDYDVVIVGGGFYGCCLALFLRSLTDRILVLEAQDGLLTRASQVNQSRIHAGFHYPRSFVTALRSRALSARFARDFSDAVVDDFQMLYAIARRRSKVSTARFHRMFLDMDAAITPASPHDAGLFNSDLIEGVFNCGEFAFDWLSLRDHLERRMAACGITVWRGAEAQKVAFRNDRCVVDLASGRSVTGGSVFNVTYAGVNALLQASGLALLPIKHELAEMALVTPPPELAGRAVTVMDGPFFSIMPFPAEGLHSLTHVRYTPHVSWADAPGGPSAYAVAEARPRDSRWRHMMMDTRRYLPCAGGLAYRKSLFEVKTVLTHNERDDGRPILLHSHRAAPDFYSVMGGKIDNVYDLFDVLPGISPAFARADARFLLGASGR